MGTLRQNQSQKTQTTAKQQAKSSNNRDIHPVEELQEMFGNQVLGSLISSQSSQQQPADSSVNLLLRQIPTANNSSIQRRPLFRGLSHELAASQKSYPVQAKLKVNQPGDKYEQEADKVAAQVVKQINHPPSPPLAHPEAIPSPKLMRKSLSSPGTGAGGIATTPHLETAIKQEQGHGQPISEDIREPLEHSFGVDFSGVRVHTDDPSDELNRSLQSVAFTTGKDIFFKRGAYQPKSRPGQELLAHELTHVVQQGGHRPVVQRKEDNKAQNPPEKKTGAIDIFKELPEDIATVKSLLDSQLSDIQVGSGLKLLQPSCKIDDKSPHYNLTIQGGFALDLGSNANNVKSTGNWKITYDSSKKLWHSELLNAFVSAELGGVFTFTTQNPKYDNKTKSLTSDKASITMESLNNTKGVVEGTCINSTGIDWKTITVTTNDINLGGIATIKD
ncbi:DUF4157 domain-containing protein, partial [Anabaenopsis sp. FSS-46]|uniref:eCIS core domain-containing protein n=1 Tax=Anabaenopsis sp. FSS-46 TaxID=2971766 RepID=UPI002475877A